MRFPIVYKIALPFVLILVLIGSFSFYLFIQSKKVFESSEVLNQLIAEQTTVSNLRNSSMQLLMATTDYISTKRESYKNQYYKIDERLMEQRRELESYKFGRHELKILNLIKLNIDSSKIYTDKIFQFTGKESYQSVTGLIEKIKNTLGDRVDKSVNELFADNMKKILFAKQSLDTYKREMFFTAPLIGLAILIVTLLTSYLTTLRIVKPILALSKAANAMSKGDYSVRPKVNTKDEIATLAQAFTQMAESIQLSYESLRRSQQFNESIIRTIPSALIVVSKNHSDVQNSESFGKGKVIMVNPNFYELFGYTTNEVIGKNIKETLAEINLSDLCKEVVDRGKVVENVVCECNSPTKGELVLNLSLAGFELGDENILIVINDITEVKRAEETIRLEKERTQSYLDVAGVILIVIDANQIISLINKKGAQVLGYDESEIIGKNWFDNYIPLEKRDILRNFFIDMMQDKTEKVEYFENEIVTKNDGEKIIAWHNVLLKCPNGKIIGSLSSGEDITQRRQAEITAEKYMSELKELNAQKDKLFSILSHDLRSPFTGLLGLSDILINEIDELKKEEIKSYITSIKEISDNLYAHLGNLLEWSRLQRGKVEFSPQKLALGETVEKIIKLLHPNVQKKEIQLVIEIDESIYVRADPYMINSVLQNLLSNAIKFTHEKGTIKIGAKRTDPFVEIYVDDSGVGMSDEEMDKVFRVDSSYTTKGTSGEVGTGLGLVICKEMIEKHGGTINIESQKGMGSSFKFTLSVCSD